MLLPTPLCLFCAFLVCAPFAVLFTLNNNALTSTPAAADCVSTTATATAARVISSASSSKSREDPLIILASAVNRTAKKNISTATTTSPPARPLPKQDTGDDDDVSLFRLAARVNSQPTEPKKIAFLFLTTGPLPFAPLWELYFNAISTTTEKLFNIYIHADPRVNYRPPFHGVFANRVIPSKPTARHTPTLIAAARRLLSQALLDDPSNYMFAILSPSCIPIHSFNFTYHTLIHSNKSFLEILKDEPFARHRWAARGNETMLPELPYEDFRIGSQFFVVTRKHARIIVNETVLWAKFKLPCLRNDTCYPEEHYFSTLLNRVDPRGIVPATLTHVKWKGGHDGHPWTYGWSDVGPDLIKKMRSRRPRYGVVGTNGSDSSVSKRLDPFLFARKFSPDSLGPLMSMANDVIFQD